MAIGVQGGPLGITFQRHFAEFLRDPMLEVLTGTPTEVTFSDGDFEYTFHGSGLAADLDTNIFGGTADAVVVEKDGGFFFDFTFPVAPNLQDLHDTANEQTGPSDPAIDAGFFRLLMPDDSPFPDYFYSGHPGRDIAEGFGGNDRFDLGDGPDRVFLTPGRDSIDGGAGRDWIDGRFLDGPLSVDLVRQRATYDNTNSFVTEVENVNGTSGNDILLGSNGRNTIRGMGGDDVINGLGGRDSISGGAGSDEIKGGRGGDTIFGDGGSDDISGGAGNDELFGDSGQDLITGGTGDDKIKGGAHSDMLWGGSGKDKIDGGSGRDDIDGGAGNDRLTGGRGNDTFIFHDQDGAINGTDRITDFNESQDKIKIIGGSAGGVEVTTDSGNTVIDYDHGKIILLGVELQESDINFIF